jgi:hypothetical protein
MATPSSSRSPKCVISASQRKCLPRKSTIVLSVVRLLIAVFALFVVTAKAQAQFQQPLVFSSGGAVMVRDDATGALTPTTGSPFSATNETLTIDVQGRYLFGIGVNSIHMYAITDPDTGAYQEVLGSPFASANTNSPTFIAVEPTGNYIAVLNSQSSLPEQAGAETFQILPNASSGPTLVPVPGSFTQLDSTIIGVSQPPGSAKAFYLYLGPQFQPDTNFANGEELNTVSINAQTGQLQGISSQNIDNSTGRCYASDPQGRYIVRGRGELEGSVDLVGIDGSFPGTTLVLGESMFPESVSVDSTGTFLYLTVGPGGLGPVHIYSLNLQTNTLTETASSPLPNATMVPGYQPDPTGPFNYGCPCPSANTLSAFTVDPQTGYFSPTANSPFTIPGIGGLTFSVVPGQQGISGPSLQLSSTELSLGTIQIGSAGTRK